MEITFSFSLRLRGVDINPSVLSRRFSCYCSTDKQRQGELSLRRNGCSNVAPAWRFASSQPQQASRQEKYFPRCTPGPHSPHTPPKRDTGWSRTWGEEHFGNGKVHKYGKSTTSESWDIVVDEETSYEAEPHYGWVEVVGDSSQLLSIQPQDKPPGVYPFLNFGSSPSPPQGVSPSSMPPQDGNPPSTQPQGDDAPTMPPQDGDPPTTPPSTQ